MCREGDREGQVDKHGLMQAGGGTGETFGDGSTPHALAVTETAREASSKLCQVLPIRLLFSTLACIGIGMGGKGMMMSIEFLSVRGYDHGQEQNVWGG